MNRLEVFSGKRASFPITDRLKGCNSLITSKGILATVFNMPESNIKNLTFDNANNEITWHSYNHYQINRRGAFSYKGTQLDNDLKTLVKEFESSKLTGHNVYTFYKSTIEALKLTSPYYTRIPRQSLEQLNQANLIDLPYVTSISKRGLRKSGTNNLTLNLPSLVNIGSSGALYNVQWEMPKQYPAVTYYEFTIQDNRKVNIASPFPNISGKIRGQGFKNCQKIPGHDYPGITSMSGRNAFINNYAATYIRLPNLTTIVFDTNSGRFGSGIWNNCNSLTELDIRSCYNFTDYVNEYNTNTGNKDSPLSSPKYFITGNNANLTVKAHIDLKTSGNWSSVVGTNVHSSLQKVINDSGTVEWYNADGTFNSINNN